MTSTTTPTRPRPTRVLATSLGVSALLLGAVACGSSANNTGATGQTGEQPGQQGGPSSQQGGAVPGVMGKVAAVTDRTAQVQGLQGQVAVSWTAATTFTAQVGAALSDVKVGDCVFVAPSGQDSSAGATPATSVTAASVRISPATDGTCGPTGRGPDGGPGPQLQGPPPSAAPQGGQRPQVRGFGGAVGKVTAVSATGFTVAAATPRADGQTPGTTSVTVTVGADTTYTTTAKGSAGDVKVGVCVQAEGTTDDTGAVSATRIAVSQPENGQCGGMIRTRSGDGATSQGS
jgi:hypothetical protein